MKMSVGLLVLFFVGCSHMGSNTAKVEMSVLHTWTQLGPDGVVLARAMVAGNECPMVNTDMANLTMQFRQETSTEYPYALCEATLDPRTSTASIGGVSLAIPKADPKKIIILGDTGCRIKKTKSGVVVAQNCNESKEWPFRRISENAAALKPDLVIHVGDYHYRENPCPAKQPGCAGSASGYNGTAWQQDFFIPARSLLTVAPWIFVRGNHESCERAGEGWFRFLEPTNMLKCSDDMPRYSVRFAKHELMVIDSAEEKNLALSLKNISAPVKTYRWLLTHRPFVTTITDRDLDIKKILPEDGLKPGFVSTVVTGHIHTLSLNQFADARPPELIIGDGGTALDTEHSFLKKGPKDKFFTYENFGFVMLEKAGEGKWTLTVHDLDGLTVKKCQLNEFFNRKSKLSCDN